MKIFIRKTITVSIMVIMILTVMFSYDFDNNNRHDSGLQSLTGDCNKNSCDKDCDCGHSHDADNHSCHSCECDQCECSCSNETDNHCSCYGCNEEHPAINFMNAFYDESGDLCVIDIDEESGSDAECECGYHECSCHGCDEEHSDSNFMKAFIDENGELCIIEDDSESHLNSINNNACHSCECGHCDNDGFDDYIYSNLNKSIFDRLFSVFNLKNYVYAECNHVLNTYWSVSSTHTAGKGHMKYHRCKLCHAKFDIHYVSLSSCAICNPAHTCTWVWHSSQTHTSGKGHKSYQKCSGCGAKRNENTYRSLSGCKICYPPHEHSFYYKSYENDSTYHTTYKECSSCSYKKYMWKKEHDFSGVYLYSSKHDDAHGGHLKYKICQANGCNSKKEYGYVKLPGCKKCYPPCKHSYKTKIDSTHIDGKGHRKYKKCSKCGDTVELGYVTLSSCKICNPPLPTNQAEFEEYAARSW
jgi:hypothetical protein